VAPTADETQRQIEGVRHEVTEILNELEKRGRGAMDWRRAAPRMATSGAKQTARSNPVALALLGLSVLLAVGAVIARARRKRAEEQLLANRFRRGARTAAEEIEEYWEEIREALPFVLEWRRSGGRMPQQAGGEPNMLKKLLWAGLTSLAMAAAGLLARRASAAIWGAAMKEQPPTAKV